MSEVAVSMINKVLSVRSGIASSGVSNKAAFNLPNEDCSVSVHTYSECSPVWSVRGAAMSA